MTPAEVNKRLPDLCERLAAQIDEATREDLHDFLVALACNNNVERTGTWLFALMRAMRPLMESDGG